jgi:hypothetical protein
MGRQAVFIEMSSVLDRYAVYTVQMRFGED